MKKTLTLALMLALLLGLGSCDKGGDAGELLSSVPGSAQGVMVVNLSKIVKDIDARADGNSLQLSNQLKSLADSDSPGNPLELLQKGGIRLSYMVMFAEQNSIFLTGFIGDEEAFRNYFETNMEEKFSAQGSMEVCKNVVIDGNRFWICDSKSLTERIPRYMKLNEKSSMASRPVADMLINDDKDITGVVSMATLASLNANPGMALYQQMLGQVDYTYFEIQFDKGKLELDARFLDSKYKPVKDTGEGFEKISMSTVKMLEGDMEYLMAVGLRKSLMRQIAVQLPVSIPGIEGIDGTLAVGVSPSRMQGSGMPAAMMAVKTASPQDGTALGEYIKKNLSTAAKVSMKGQTLLVRTAELSGDLNAGPHLKDIEGSYLGIVMSPDALAAALPGNNIPFEGASLSVKPDDSSFKLEIKIYTGSSSNSLITLLKVLEAASHR